MKPSLRRWHNDGTAIGATLQGYMVVVAVVVFSKVTWMLSLLLLLFFLRLHYFCRFN